MTLLHPRHFDRTKSHREEVEKAYVGLSLRKVTKDKKVRMSQVELDTAIPQATLSQYRSEKHSVMIPVWRFFKMIASIEGRSPGAGVAILENMLEYFAETVKLPNEIKVSRIKGRRNATRNRARRTGEAQDVRGEGPRQEPTT